MCKKILIIEDNEENLKLFSSILKLNGYKILEAKNGADGVRLAKTEIPNLILTDIEMPVMNGFEAFKILKSDSLTKNIPTIVITAMKINKDNFIKLGFIDYIAKPIRLNDFIKTIEKYIRQDKE
jgi:two-component system, cell cycle response regulator DivK